MLKQILGILLLGTTSLSICTPKIALAETAKTFQDSETLYPDICTMAFDNEVYYCDNLVIGFFNNGTGNIKFCDNKGTCLILMIGSNEANKILNDQPFQVRNLALQSGNTILRRFQGNVNCAIGSSEGFGCLGNLSNGTSLAIYTE